MVLGKFYEIKSQKFRKLSFSRWNSFSTGYFISSHKLENVNSFIDLGLLFGQKLRYKLHIKPSINGVRPRHGFFDRGARELDDPHVVK